MFHNVERHSNAGARTDFMDKVFLKGLTILEVIANSEGPRGITDLAAELKLTKSNVHRLLQALVHRGYVERHPQTARYSCTLKLWQLGLALGNRIEVRNVAHPYMTTLAAQTQESVHLSVLQGANVVYIDKVDSPQPIGAYSTIGRQAPPHCVATGKALLSALPDQEVRQRLKRLTRYTPRTIVGFDKLSEELGKVRSQGYAINRGEWTLTVCGAASPIFDASNRACAAIGISGPAERLTLSKLRSFGAFVVDAARAISRRLGFVPKPNL